MSFIFNPTRNASSTGYVISNSCRFNDDDDASLSRTFATGDNTHKGGFSWWFKRGNITQFSELASSSDGGERIYIINTDFLTIQLANGSQVSTSSLKLRDPTAWYNLVVSVDGTASGDNRLLAWLNGVVIALSDNDPGATPFSGGFNGNEVHYWFKNPGGSGDRYHFDGYQAETVFIDGTIAPTDVGEFDTNGNWVPIDPSDLVFGANGFWLDFAVAESVGDGAGTDVSGNNNHFAASGIDDADQMTDSPTDDSPNVGNFCTWNAIDAGTGTLSDGNLVLASTTDRSGTFGLVSGKWAWKITAAASAEFGVVQGSLTGTESTHSTTSGEVLEFQFNVDTGVLEVSVDGAAYAGVATGLTSGPYFPLAKGACTADFGQNGFTLDDAAFKYLNTSNMAAPAIADPSAGFNLVDFTGTAAELSVAFGGNRGNTALSPDMVLVRDRSNNFDWEVVDTTRGPTVEMKWNANAGETTEAQGVKSFTSDGVTLGTDVGYNTDGSSNMLLGFKEGAAYGFDMALWTGNGASSQDVDHSLGVTPEFIVACRRDGTEANRAWHSALTDDTYSVLWGDPGYGVQAVASFAATHGADTFGVDGQHNISSETYIAYLWASINQFSKFGKYTGNGSPDGVFVHCGFRPKALFVRRYTGNYSTLLYNTTSDTYNVGTTANVFADDGAEQTSLQLLDITASGFKWRQSAGDQNGSGGLYMWGAWAEHPFGGGGSQARAR